MGCDIYMWAEVEAENKYVNWEAVGNKFKRDYGDKRRKTCHPYDDRNYNLFAILAGVRNYQFNIEPISEPKGLPSKASIIYRGNSHSMGPDGHSHSYFTIKELLDFDWKGNVAKGEDGEFSYYELCQDFVDRVIPTLQELGDPDRVRIVFFFDN